MLSTMEPISLDFHVVSNNIGNFVSSEVSMNYRGCRVTAKLVSEAFKLTFTSPFKTVMTFQLSVNENSIIRKIADGALRQCVSGTIHVCHAEMNYEKMLIEEASRFAHAPDDLIEYFTREGCDQLTIVCGEKEWKVSSELMCARSPVFARMLSSELEEAKTKRYIIKDFDPEAVRMMVECCMTNDITKDYSYNEVEQTAFMFDLVKLADKYDMKQLMGIASIEVAKNISLTNFMQTVRLADNHNSELLKEFCDAFYDVFVCASKMT